MTSTPNEPNELEISLVRWALGAPLQELACAMEAARHAPDDRETTELFARAAAIRKGDGYADAIAAILSAPSGMDRLEAAYARIDRAQEILREREGEGWDE